MDGAERCELLTGLFLVTLQPALKQRARLRDPHAIFKVTKIGVSAPFGEGGESRSSAGESGSAANGGARAGTERGQNGDRVGTERGQSGVAAAAGSGPPLGAAGRAAGRAAGLGGCGAGGLRGWRAGGQGGCGSSTACCCAAGTGAPYKRSRDGKSSVARAKVSSDRGTFK